MSAERIEWIDIAKGIGIILVVLGHCVVKEDMVHKIIFSFHMPLFFFLSGYCFRVNKYHNLNLLISRRGKALLLPYLQFYLAGMAVTLCIPSWRESLTIKGILTDIYMGYPILSNNTSIWYLISLFVITVVYYLVWKISLLFGRWYKFVIGFCTVLSGGMGYAIYLVRMWVENRSEDGGGFLPGGRLPLTIDASLMAFVFFVLGIWCYNTIKVEKIKIYKTVFVLGATATVLFGGFLNSRVNIHGCSYGNIVYFFLAALGGIEAVIGVSEMISSSNMKASSLIKKIFIFYGRNSLFMFGIQSLFVHLYLYCVNTATGKDYVLYETVPSGYGILGFIIITIVFLPVSWYIGMFIKDHMVRKYV